MKMRLLNWGIAVGCLVMLAGLSILLRTMFRVELPLFRTFGGILLILVGVRVILHAWMPVQYLREAHADRTGALLQPHQIGPGGLKYDVIFSEGVVDLTRLDPPAQDLNVEVNVIFGAATVRLDPSVPFDLQASAAFGEVRLPDQRSLSFGELRSGSPGEAQGPRIHLKVSAVFASCRVEEGALQVSARPGVPGPLGAATHP
jgi:hypothetical protein